MNNWSILDGTTYVAKHGNDVLGDGTIGNPFRSFGQGLSQVANGGKLVVGTGDYEETIIAIFKTIEIIADGVVRFVGTNIGGNFYSSTTSVSYTWDGFVFTNWNGAFVNAGNSADRPIFRNCVFQDLTQLTHLAGSSAVATTEKCIFINVPDVSTYSVGINTASVVRNCTFINSNLKDITVLSSNYFDINSKVIITNHLFTDFNDFEGTVVGDRIQYIDPSTQAVKQYDNLAAFEADWLPNGLPTHNLDVAPQFADVGNRDYHLLVGSPLVGAGYLGLDVGAETVGQSYTRSHPAMETNAILDANVSWNASNKLELTSGSEGAILTGIIDEGVSTTIGKIDVKATNLFPSDLVDSTRPQGNTDITSGNIVADTFYYVSGYDDVTYDGNVFITGTFFKGNTGVTNYTTSGTGQVLELLEAPNKLTLQMEWGEDPALADTQGLKLFQIGQVATIDGTGKGNGEQDFDPLTAQTIKARYRRLRIVLRQDAI